MSKLDLSTERAKKLLRVLNGESHWDVYPTEMPGKNVQELIDDLSMTNPRARMRDATLAFLLQSLQDLTKLAVTEMRLRVVVEALDLEDKMSGMSDSQG